MAFGYEDYEEILLLVKNIEKGSSDLRDYDV